MSHALNHPERVTAELRERVQRAVDALGYAPNPSARNLRIRRTNLVALILPDICNPFFPELARAIQDELAARAYDVLIYNSDVPGGHTPIAAQHYFRQLGPKRFDGLLLVGEAVRPQISTVACSPRALGQAAARLLLQRLGSVPPPVPQKVVPLHSLLLRSST